MMNIIKVLGILFLILAVIVFALSCGIIDMSFLSVWSILLKLFENVDSVDLDGDVIYYLRLPRLVLGLIVGCGLAVSGTVMQAVMKNPLADPYLLGLSSGASLGAVAAIILGFSDVYGLDCVGISAFGGAILVTLFIVLFSSCYGRKNVSVVLLTGLAVNAVCSAIMSFLVFVFSDIEHIQSITYWLMGSLLNNNWNNILFLAVIVVTISIFFMTRFRSLDLMLYGDDISITLGRNLAKARNLYILLCSVMVGFIVYNTGVIGFIGLIVPHICRSIVGNSHVILLPISALSGAVLLTLSDVLSRVIIPGKEIPIGVIVSLCGSPIFIYMLVNKKYGYGK